MIHCIVKGCSWKTTSFNILYEHLNRMHNSISTYTCNYTGCTRNYNVRASFFRHFKKHYEDTATWRNLDSIHESRNFNEVLRSSESEMKTVEKQNKQENKQLQLNNVVSIDDLIKLNELESQMKKLSISLNLKWLNMNTLPRKIVFDMQKDVRTNILQPFKDVVTTMETAGFMSKDSSLVFNKMFAIFDGIETEYKLTEELKRSDLYAAPREFIISDELRAGVSGNQQQLKNDPVSGKCIQ